MYRYILLLLIVFQTCLVYSQDDKIISFSAGINGSTISGSNSSINKLGLNSTVSYSLFKNPSFGKEIGVSFIQKGAFRTPNQEKGIYDYYKLTENYIHIPISFLYYKSGITYFGSLSPGYLISFKEENVNGIYPISIPFRKYEFAISTGVKLEITKNTFLKATFSNSIIPVRLHSSGTFRLNRGQYNSSLVLSFGYFISK